MTSIDQLIREIVRDELAKNPPPSSSPSVVLVDPRRLYSVRSAAELIEVSPSYLYGHINQGEIAVVELGAGKGKQRISANELQRFIDARTFGAREPT